MFDSQMQQTESGKKVWGKIWMSIESTLRSPNFNDSLTYGVTQEESAVRVVISTSHSGPVMDANICHMVDIKRFIGTMR